MRHPGNYARYQIGGFPDDPRNRIHAANEFLETAICSLEPGEFFSNPVKEIGEESLTSNGHCLALIRNAWKIGLEAEFYQKVGRPVRYIDFAGVGWVVDDSQQPRKRMWVAVSSNMREWRQPGTTATLLAQLLQTRVGKAEKGLHQRSERESMVREVLRKLKTVEERWVRQGLPSDDPSWSDKNKKLQSFPDLVVFCAPEIMDRVRELFGRGVPVVSLPSTGPSFVQAVENVILALRDRLQEGWAFRIEPFLHRLTDRLKPTLGAGGNDREISEGPLIADFEFPPLPDDRSDSKNVPNRVVATMAKYLEFGWEGVAAASTNGGIAVWKDIPLFFACGSTLPLGDEHKSLLRLWKAETFDSLAAGDRFTLVGRLLYKHSGWAKIFIGKLRGKSPDAAFVLPPYLAAAHSTIRQLAPSTPWNVISIVAGCSRTTDSAVLDRLLILAHDLGDDFIGSNCLAVLTVQQKAVSDFQSLALPEDSNHLRLCEMLEECIAKSADIPEADLASFLTPSQREKGILNYLIDPTALKLIKLTERASRGDDAQLARAETMLPELVRAFHDTAAPELTQDAVVKAVKMVDTIQSTEPARSYRVVEWAAETIGPWKDFWADSRRATHPVAGLVKAVMKLVLGGIVKDSALQLPQRLRDWLEDRVRVTAIVRGDRLAPVFHPVPSSTSNAREIRAVLGSRDSCRYYSALFIASPADNLVSIDIQPLLEGAAAALEKANGEERASWGWLRHKISETNEMAAILIQRLGYVPHFPLALLPLKLSGENASARILLTLNSPLIVRCLGSSKDGREALQVWIADFSRACAAAFNSSTGDGRPHFNSVGLLRDVEGMACAALDLAREQLDGGGITWRTVWFDWCLAGRAFTDPDAAQSKARSDEEMELGNASITPLPQANSESKTFHEYLREPQNSAEECFQFLFEELAREAAEGGREMDLIAVHIEEYLADIRRSNEAMKTKLAALRLSAPKMKTETKDERLAAQQHAKDLEWCEGRIITLDDAEEKLVKMAAICSSARGHGLLDSPDTKP